MPGLPSVAGKPVHVAFDGAQMLLKQWFTPAPYTTPVAELDVRPGGANLIVMRDPDGKEFPSRGVYLEVVENERLVITDAYTEAWEPSEKGVHDRDRDVRE